MPGLPAEFAGYSAYIPDYTRWVAWSSAGIFWLEFNSRDFPDDGEDFKNARAVPSTNVVDGPDRAIFEFGRSDRMNRGEVDHVNVVTYACAIRRCVVCSEDLRASPRTKGPEDSGY